MDLRWTEEAATNLEGIADYIGRENPAMATRVANTIHDYVADQLTQFLAILHTRRSWPDDFNH